MMRPHHAKSTLLSKLLVLGAFLLPETSAARPEPELVSNADLNQGEDGPQHWSLSGGKGRWVEREILEVTGSGDDSNYWRSDRCGVQPGVLYLFRMRARRLGGTGTVVSGPSFANRDFTRLSKKWRWYDYVFRVPDNVSGPYLRLGQWRSTGTVQFDAVRLNPALPVYRRAGNLLLGEGELVEAGRYTFTGTFRHRGSNFHRTLYDASAGFNTDRWVFGGNSHVTYRFGLPGYEMLSARIAFTVNYHTNGGCVAEISRDLATWHAVTEKLELGQAEGTLPTDVLPAREIFLRLRAKIGSSSFQVNEVTFLAELGGGPPIALEDRGQTIFADVAETSPDVAITDITLEGEPNAGRSTLRIHAKNHAREAVSLALTAWVSEDDHDPIRLRPQKSRVAAGADVNFVLPLSPERPGRREVRITVAKPGGKPASASLVYSVPDFYRSDFGYRITDDSARVPVWWCDATHKVSPQRVVPREGSSAARLSAAKNDFEAVQVVVRPREPLKGLTAAASDLKGPEGAKITAGHVQVLRVAYHFVHHPTDSSGVRGRWPDALPPLTRPLDVPAGENQPLWVLVHVPHDARAGDYSGRLTLHAENWSARVPIELHVWNFALPARNHIETAFGFSAGDVFRYHQLKTEADKRKVLDRYFQSFAEHRISPYDWTPLDPIRVRFLSEADPPRAELDFTAFDRAMSRAVEKYRFTNFRLPIQGMGGGTFHSRHEPRIGSFAEHTAEYRAMFSSYVGQLEDHLRDRGWLGMAYVYWFDEPAPRDYAFVTNGMSRLKRYAPGLQRMLTEEPGKELAGSVEIWCPVSFHYDHEAADQRRPHGERFWWYVCTGPKAPYCTLFIDHPATELRVWLWQTWKRKIAGILVWRANYWTSSAAFPDRPQNPYADPMGYVSGYSTPRGVKRFWGNGDGRFIYPPESAAVPGVSGDGPILEGPVSSIRWEMLREGIEDWEFLYLLRELLERDGGRVSAQEKSRFEELLKVPDTISSDMTTFTTDPAPIYARREAIARAIELLVR